MKLSDYQSQAQQTNLHRGGDPIGFFLHGLAGEVGTLCSEYKKRLRDGAAHRRFSERMAEELGDVLWYAAALATELGLDLDLVATANLEKTVARWSPSAHGPTSLDNDAPEEQRLPRRFSAVFRMSGRQAEVYDESGAKLGDRLSDNAHVEDHYRFHDAFHLTHAAVLGWSPVLRSMLRRKRKYDPVVDEVEDGARAIFTEEAVTAAVFRFADANNFFAGVDHVDSELLDLVRRMVSGLEVSVRSAGEWEAAILQGYSVWRQLVEAGGGVVECDCDLGAITFRPEAPAVPVLDP